MTGKQFSLASAAALTVGLVLAGQGCDKAAEKVKLELFPGSGRSGKAYVPPRPPKPPCKGASCPKSPEPPLGQMTAPIQAPPRAGKQEPPPRKPGLAKPKPGSKVPAKSVAAAPAHPVQGGPGARPEQPHKPPLEKAERPDDEALPRPDEYSVAKDGSGSRYLSPAAVKGPAVRESPVRPSQAAPSAGKAAPGVAMADVADEAAEVSPLTEAADVLGVVADDPGDVGSTRLQVSRTQDFKVVLIDQVYSFIEDADLYREFQQSGLKDGTYYIRFAVIDLLDFQHPYTRPKRFRLRGAAGARKTYPAARP
ncbi:MAG: hypothetical protein HY924_04445 [Elusimicrobia bacterium]|nr:hypothetical protein [Elusimicrobiota bacterium]